MPDQATPHEDGCVTAEQREHVLIIALDRPQKRNGLTPKMFRELAAALTRLETDDALRCGVLHGVGEHFSAGLDLPKYAAARKAGEVIHPPELIDPYNLREPLRTKPLVAAPRGICFTAGLEFVLAADIVIAADDCRFTQMEVKRGIMSGGGGITRLVERAGWGNAMKILLTGDEFNAQEAYRFNLVQEIVPPGQELPRAIEVAQKIAEQAPLAVRATIENARISLGEGWRIAASKTLAANNKLFASEDAKEGIQSFIEKRPARFAGR